MEARIKCRVENNLVEIDVNSFMELGAYEAMMVEHGWNVSREVDILGNCYLIITKEFVEEELP